MQHTPTAISNFISVPTNVATKEKAVPAERLGGGDAYRARGDHGNIIQPDPVMFMNVVPSSRNGWSEADNVILAGKEMVFRMVARVYGSLLYGSHKNKDGWHVEKSDKRIKLRGYDTKGDRSERAGE